MNPGDKVIVMYCVLPADKWDGVKLPQGSFAKAFDVGTIDDLTEVQACKGWGAMMAASINRLAKKLCPDRAQLILGNEPL